jgi:hypothetical protein
MNKVLLSDDSKQLRRGHVAYIAFADYQSFRGWRIS